MSRIAQVIAGAGHGGAENMYVRLVRGVHNSGRFEQKAFLRTNTQREQALTAAGIAHESFRFGGPIDLPDRWHYRNRLHVYQPDLVMTWMNRACIATPPGDYVLLSRLGHYYKLKYHRHADYWIGISRGICDHLVAGGMPADRVFHIPNFADESPLEKLPRDSFDTPPDRPLIVAAGRLHINKAFDILLQALQSVPDAWLWLAGTGPEEQALMAQARDLGIDERVRFLGWRDDIQSLMASADLFVCPSRHEGLGSVVMEAWHAKCPLVVTNSQGPGEVVENGVTGLVTPVDEVEPLAAAIRELLGNASLRHSLAERAFRHYQSEYSEKVIIDKYNDLYGQLLTIGKANPAPSF